jgi:hypothetical protein
MGKLVVQLLGMAGVVLLGRHLGWGGWLIGGAVVVAIVVVHLVFDRLVGGSGHLGAAAIANDDPLLLAALAEAKRTWPELERWFRERPRDTVVKFRLAMESGEPENVWGDLLALGEGVATVRLRTPPYGRPLRAITDPLEVPLAEVIDWQVVLDDDTLRGGFTQQATFRILERDQGSLPKAYAEQLARYRNEPWEPAGAAGSEGREAPR